jgi:hypothetical protein
MYVQGYEAGMHSERERTLRIILSELRSSQIEAQRTGKEHTREHAAIQVKLGLLYEMVK